MLPDQHEGQFVRGTLLADGEHSEVVLIEDPEVELAT